MAKKVKAGDVVHYDGKHWRVTEVFTADSGTEIAACHSVQGDQFRSVPVGSIDPKTIKSGLAKTVNAWHTADQAGDHEAADGIRAELRDQGIKV